MAAIRPRVAGQRYLNEKGLPSPARPTDQGREYAFPEDVSRISSAELGNLRLRLAALHGYASRLLSEEESRLAPTEEVHQLRLDVVVGRMTRGWDKKLPAVDVLRAMAIDEDPALAATRQAIIEMRSVVRRLKAQISIYENHLAVLSREQARQEMLAKHFA